ncbi:TVP38/TMEM64 family protein [Marinoscillum pacificum]|uniref:TVP38/TMEM64 family protein n=1 Tax=Marinoscillum pacificum TaxID=392723 RepID=UPI0021579292|nr:TVP38/TMEM64 family protein [Marinoscillum pacificum]
MSKISTSKLIPAAVTIVLIGTLAAFYFFNSSFHDFANEGWKVLTSENQDKIQAWVKELSFWGPIIILAGFIIQMFAFVIPSWLLMVVSILAYGPWKGSLLAITGVLLASVLAYGIGNYLSEYTLQKLLGKKSEKKMKSYLEQYGFWIIAIFRFAPFLSNDTISFVAGLSSMRFWKFVAATTIGILPLIGFIAYLGDSTDRLKTGFIWASAVCLVGFGLYICWDQKKQKA